MKSSTLVLAATIATAVYAQNIPREKYSRKSLASSNGKKVNNVITANGRTLRRQESASPAAPALSNDTTGAEVEEPEEEEQQEGEEEEESESESESDSESSSSEEEEEDEEDEGEEGEEGEEEEPEAAGEESLAAGEEEVEVPPVEGGTTSAVALIDGPSGQIAMGMGVASSDGSCTCDVVCPAGSLPT